MFKPYQNIYIAFLLTLVVLGSTPGFDLIITWGTHDWLYPSCKEFSGRCSPLLLAGGAGFASMLLMTIVGIVILQVQAVAWATRLSR